MANTIPTFPYRRCNNETRASGLITPVNWLPGATAAQPAATDGVLGAGPTQGDLWYDTTRHMMQTYSNGAWVDSGGAGIQTFTGAIVAAAGITATGLTLSQVLTMTPVTHAATTDGLTTGIIAATTTVVIATVGTTNFAVTVPTPAAGKVLIIFNSAAANNLEVLTAATSGITINGVDSDGTNQLDVPAQSGVILVGSSATAWVGGLLSAAVPDND